MLKHLNSIVTAIDGRFRSRAVRELEDLALRHQLHVLRRQRPGRPRLMTSDRLLCLALPIMAALPGDYGVGQTG
jgi:hypothetical protein